MALLSIHHFLLHHSKLYHSLSVYSSVHSSSPSLLPLSDQLHIPIIICAFCGAHFSTNNQLKRHREVDQKREIDVIYNCSLITLFVVVFDVEIKWMEESQWENTKGINVWMERRDSVWWEGVQIIVMIWGNNTYFRSNLLYCCEIPED